MVTSGSALGVWLAETQVLRYISARSLHLHIQKVKKVENIKLLLTILFHKNRHDNDLGEL